MEITNSYVASVTEGIVTFEAGLERAATQDYLSGAKTELEHVTEFAATPAAAIRAAQVLMTAAAAAMIHNGASRGLVRPDVKNALQQAVDLAWEDVVAIYPQDAVLVEE